MDKSVIQDKKAEAASVSPGSQSWVTSIASSVYDKVTAPFADSPTVEKVALVAAVGVMVLTRGRWARYSEEVMEKAPGVLKESVSKLAPEEVVSKIYQDTKIAPIELSDELSSVTSDHTLADILRSKRNFKVGGLVGLGALSEITEPLKCHNTTATLDDVLYLPGHPARSDKNAGIGTYLALAPSLGNGAIPLALMAAQSPATPTRYWYKLGLDAGGTKREREVEVNESDTRSFEKGQNVPVRYSYGAWSLDVQLGQDKSCTP